MLPNKFLIIKNWPKSKNLKIDEKTLKNYIVNEKRNFKNNPKNFRIKNKHEISKI